MKSDLYQRVNISLPTTTLRRVDRITEHGSRSRLIDVAINAYLAKRSREKLHKALREEAIEWGERDRRIAEELFNLNDSWGNEDQ